MTATELRRMRIRDLRRRIQDDVGDTTAYREAGVRSGKVGLELLRRYELIEDLKYCENLLAAEKSR